jgi:hypothetical protein
MDAAPVDDIFLILTRLPVLKGFGFGAKPGFFKNRDAAMSVREILAIANSYPLGYYKRTSYEAFFLSGIRNSVVIAVGGEGPGIS